MFMDYERNSGINCLKLETANENLRAIFDKRYNTAGKSFGVSNKKNYQLKINTSKKAIKTEQKLINLLTDAKDKETYNYKKNELYATLNKIDKKGDDTKKSLMFQSDLK